MEAIANGPDRGPATGSEPPAPDADAEPQAAGRWGAFGGPVRSRFGLWWTEHYTFFGTSVGLVFIILSLTPSLLPRGPLFQGIVSGSAGAIGYMFGVFGVWLVQYMRGAATSPKPPRWAWLALAVVSVIGIGSGQYLFHSWQNDVRDLMDVPHLRWYNYPQAALLGIVLFFVFVTAGQWVRRLVDLMMRLLERVAPPRVSGVVAVGLLLVLSIGLINGVIARAAMDILNSSFNAVNEEDTTASGAPTTPLRSGGPQSQVSWESLGREGRIFVTGGPTTDELTQFNGSPAMEPIRVYAGKNPDGDLEAAAQAAANELQRTGGLDRAVVAIGATTGTGWINEAEASAIEYMFNGDSAIVTMQYSYLPSWLSFLVDQENARQAGVALFEAVDALVRTVPEAQRPRVVMFGESLGSFGGEAPFLALNNLIARTDGALFSGPTFNNTIWTTLTRERDPGSPMWLPTYNQGKNVRFVARADDLNSPAGVDWDEPRVVYLQHASDPIAWWNPDLLFNEPDWLREPRGYDVSPRMNWIPVVTFLQLSADMAVAVDVPDGHGHRYVKDVANAWAAVLQPPGWTDDKTQRLRDIVHAD